MIEIEIPKDITKYESKLIGPLSARNCVGVAIAAIMALPFYFIARKYNGGNTNQLINIITMFLAVPGGLIGWAHPYGMNAEEFMLSFLKYNIIAPLNRKYISVSKLEETYNYIIEEEIKRDKKLYAKEQKRRKLNKKRPTEKKNRNPDLVGYV